MNLLLNKHQDRHVLKRSSSNLSRAVVPSLLMLLATIGCKHEAGSSAAEAPPTSVQVVETGSSDTVHVDGPERFPIVQASSQQVRSALQVTGSVNPDVSREIPVLSLANGRVVALHVGLGDYVHRGEFVMEVQSPDVSTAYDSYLKAVNDEHLTSVTLNRDTLLYNKGAISKSQLEAAQNGDDDSNADLTAAEQQLKILGVDRKHPGENVKIYAPASGVIIAQNVSASGAAGITYAGAAGSLTIADLSHVWVICDVYENDLADVHLGQHADIKINAFPGKTFSGTISDIGAQLDPSLRTAKVRIQVANPQNLLRLGMFATASLEGLHPQQETAVQSNSILQLHDLTYVFEPLGSGNFKRVLVKTGATLPDNQIEIIAGLGVGQRIVGNALDLENTADQQ